MRFARRQICEAFSQIWQVEGLIPVGLPPLSTRAWLYKEEVEQDLRNKPAMPRLACSCMTSASVPALASFSGM